MISLKYTTAVLAAACAQAFAQAPSNPISVASAVLLGLRYPSNTGTMRDLGYQSQVGSFWINTFGDGVGCTNAATQAGCGCAYITGRDGAAVQTFTPLYYTDINPRTDLCGGVAQMAPFCPYIGGEVASNGHGITKISAVNSTHGLMLSRPTFSDSLESPGAGIDVVDVSSGTPICKRPFGISSWGPDEPKWGQLSQIIVGSYIYVYANGPNFGGVFNSTVLARVAISQAFDSTAYQYYHGSGNFNSNRIYLSQLKPNSPELLGIEASQGQVYYSTYYQKYIMFYSYIGFVQAAVANNPWGPFSSSVSVYTPPKTVNGIIYSPNVQEAFSTPSGKWIILSYTDSNTLPAINITFT